MKVRNYQEQDFPALLEFNKKMFSGRDQIEESIKYRIYHSTIVYPNPWKKSFVALNDKDEMVGQMLHIPVYLYYKKQKHVAHWGMDFIVDKSTRGTGMGKLLAKHSVTDTFFFGVGFSPISLKLHQELGMVIQGYVTKFVKLNSIFSLIKFFTKPAPKSSSQYSFPNEIALKKSAFRRIRQPEEIHSPNGCWDDEAMEFSRDTDFLRWRFLHYKDKYAVYKYEPEENNDARNSVFFVVRPVAWKGVNCLMMVDFRYNKGEKAELQAILTAVRKLMKMMKFTAIITASSQATTNKIFRKHLYFEYGKRKMEVASTFPLDDNSNPEKEHDRIIVTFADSDIDFYYGDNQW